MSEPLPEPQSSPSSDGQAPIARPRRRFLKIALASAGVLAAAGAGAGIYVHWLKSLPAYVPPKVRVPPLTIDGEIRIVAIGDWGSHDRRQAQVAAAIEKHAAKIGGFHCGLLLGDNFYWDGVSSVDDPTWQHVFEEVYDTPHLGLMPWHAILGNHDYRGDEEAQIAYTKTQKVKRWNMPAHYYRVDLGPGSDDDLGIPVPGVGREGKSPWDLVVTLLAIDTNPEFQAREDGAWAAQLAWLEGQLKGLEKRGHRRIIVMGHHPCYSYSDNGPEKNVVDDILPILKKHPPWVYIGGDDHNMQVIEQHGTKFIVAGCGGKTLYDVEQGDGTLFAAEEFGFCVLTLRTVGWGDPRGPWGSPLPIIEFYNCEGEQIFLRDYLAKSPE